MGMTEDDGLKTGGGRIEIEAVEIVEKIDGASPGFDDIGFRKLQGPGAEIDISPYRPHRGDAPQFIKDRRIAHVPCVENEVAPLQRLEGLRADQTMRIGDDPEPERLVVHPLAPPA